MPILDSIIYAHDCSLKYIQLPQKLCKQRSKVLAQFLERYNQLLRNLGGLFALDVSHIVDVGLQIVVAKHTAQIVLTAKSTAGVQRETILPRGYCLSFHLVNIEQDRLKSLR